MIDNSVKIEVQLLPEMHRVKVGKQYLYLEPGGYYDFVDEESYEEDEYPLTIDEVKDVAKDLGIKGLPYGDDRYSLTLDEVKDAEKQLGIQGLQKKWHEAAE